MVMKKASDDVLLTSLLFSFVNENDVILPGFSGPIASSIFLELINRVDPKLSTKLHETKKPKPYSCTPLFRAPLSKYRASKCKNFIKIPAGARIWFRVALVGGKYVAKVLKSLVSNADFSFKVFNSKFEFMGLEFTQYDFESLIKESKQLLEQLWKKGLSVKISFYTPTRFAVASITGRRKEPKFSLFPEPERVFPNIARHWNSFMKWKIPLKELEKYVIDFVYVTDYSLKPITMKTTHGRVIRGSVGYIIYNITEKSQAEILLTLLKYGELFNIGTGRSMGIGVNKVAVI